MVLFNKKLILIIEKHSYNTYGIYVIAIRCLCIIFGGIHKYLTLMFQFRCFSMFRWIHEYSIRANGGVCQWTAEE